MVQFGVQLAGPAAAGEQNAGGGAAAAALVSSAWELGAALELKVMARCPKKHGAGPEAVAVPVEGSPEVHNFVAKRRQLLQQAVAVALGP